MAQFDVYRGKGVALLLDCQADLLGHLKTRIMAPLFPADQVPDALPRLMSDFVIEGSMYRMATHLVSAVPRDELREFVASLENDRLRIIAAIDLLFTGV